MQVPTHYDPNQVENKWYQYWLTQGFFKAKPNSQKAPYTIVMPPPNITGVLHMGHALNNTIQDVLIRKARMEGKEACWVPGLDHASIATEAKVVAMLQAKGIKKTDLTREEFLIYAWEWKEKYGGIILEQIQQIGASCDWDRLVFTLDPAPSNAVKDIFIKLYEEGLIYQSKRIINWDPVGKTALADDEVIYKTVASKLYYIRYVVVDSQEEIIIATTRPETILGDTAVCVHPDDNRYKKLHGKQVIVPIINRLIPIITDAYVDKEFGTGCLKITPAHDINDYKLSQKHSLDIIDILNEDGTINNTAQHYIGEDRFVVREKIAQELQKQGLLIKVEPHTSNIGFSERTNAIVEPRISKQWFVNMQQLVKPALEYVLDETIKFHPSKFTNMYQNWLLNIKDWCISRQLWWGHQIPAFYLPDKTVIVARDKATALVQAKKNPLYVHLTENDLKQEEDVLDTWFSSWLWPISVFNGFQEPENEDINYFYPTNDLVTAPEIIFFWVARMIMAGYAFKDKPPFKNVYFTGIVRDKLGRKMSKSLGNSPDPLELIKRYSADGVRVGMLLSSPAGNDLLFDVKLCEQGRNFANKLWNAFRLVKNWGVQPYDTITEHTIAINWLEAKFNQVLFTVEKHFEQFRISDALMVIYKFVWDDFCAWYLEMIKPAYGSNVCYNTYTATVSFLEKTLKMLHPFMPFITEEIWHQIKERTSRDCIIIAPWPVPVIYEESLLLKVSLACSLITEIRNIRASENIPFREALPMYVNAIIPDWVTELSGYIKKLGGITIIETVQNPIAGSRSFAVQEYIFYISLQKNTDLQEEKIRVKEELDYFKDFLVTTNNKLQNKKFLEQAPVKIIEMEYKKQADTLAKVKNLENRLQELL